METIYLKHGDSVTSEKTPAVLALGFFDGVHLGHQKIIRTARTIADKKGLPLAVMTFDPHPREVMGLREKTGQHLTPFREKAAIMKRMGVDFLYVVHFNKEFGSLTPEQFVHSYIINLQARHVTAGFDFTYGRCGKGDMELLRQLGGGIFGVTVVEKVESRSRKIGSTLIRELVSSGSVAKIPPLLGSHYEVKGMASGAANLSGFGKGSGIIKVDFREDFVLPPPGRYRVNISIGNANQPGVCIMTRGRGSIFVPALPDRIIGRTCRLEWVDRLSDLTELPRKQAVEA